MSDEKITEITEQMAEAEIGAEKTVAETQDALIGKGVAMRVNKNVIIPGLKIDDFIVAFRRQQNPAEWKSVYIVPVLIDYAAGDQDVAGAISYRGMATYDAYCFSTEDDIKRDFPSLVAIDGWKRFFSNLFAVNENAKKMLKEHEAYYPLMIMAGNPIMQIEVASICRRDYVMRSLAEK